MPQSSARKAVLLAAPFFAMLAASSQGANVSGLADPNATLAAPRPALASTSQRNPTALLAPSVSGWIEAEARALLARNLPADAMIEVARRDVVARFAGQSYTPVDVETLVQLVMSAAAADAQNDLGNLRAALQAGKTRRPPQGSTTAQMSDLSAQDQLTLQMYMDRSNKAQLALSNIMKQASDTQSATIKNLK
jgi:hypothetical protein